MDENTGFTNLSKISPTGQSNNSQSLSAKNNQEQTSGNRSNNMQQQQQQQKKPWWEELFTWFYNIPTRIEKSFEYIAKGDIAKGWNALYQDEEEQQYSSQNNNRQQKYQQSSYEEPQDKPASYEEEASRQSSDQDNLPNYNSYQNNQQRYNNRYQDNPPNYNDSYPNNPNNQQNNQQKDKKEKTFVEELTDIGKKMFAESLLGKAIAFCLAIGPFFVDLFKSDKKPQIEKNPKLYYIKRGENGAKSPQVRSIEKNKSPENDFNNSGMNTSGYYNKINQLDKSATNESMMNAKNPPSNATATPAVQQDNNKKQAKK